MKQMIRFIAYAVVLIAVSSVRANDSVAFFRAVGVDNASGVKDLLAKGQDPNALSEKGQTALFLAARDESPRVLQVLLEHPALKVDLANAANETALMMAAIKGNLAGAKLLLDKGAAVNRAGWTPLHYAASSSTDTGAEVVALLLARGALVEAPSPNRTTPLMMAARYGTDASALLLLAKGASTKARNDADLDAAAFARLGARDALAAKLEQIAR
jgi:uncharacterized protein